MTHLTTSTPSRTPGAAQSLAHVEPVGDYVRVTLPHPFAEDAVRFFLHICRFDDGTCETFHAAHKLGSVNIPSGSWVISTSDIRASYLFSAPVRRWAIGIREYLLYPFGTLTVAAAIHENLLRALEFVKPIEYEPDGRPAPWVPPTPRVDPTYTPESREDDAVALTADAPLPDEPVAAATNRLVHHISDEAIRRWFIGLCATAGISPLPELVIVRNTNNHLGFVAGRVWFRIGGPTLRVRLQVCPNADLAEVISTVLHELAHPIASAMTGSTAHDHTMKTALVDLAARQFGERWFAVPRARLTAPMPMLDSWVTTCIRAALRDGDIPAARIIEDTATARLLGRLKKLRELAADQIGLPEGITATATANDLVTLHELGIRGVELADINPEQLVDRWVPLSDGSVWRRTLAHGIASYFNVFSLMITGAQRMHLFGTYADVVASEYLFNICEARIERECVNHITAWKAAVGKTTSAMTRKEKTAFCDSAAVTFGRKLAAMRAEDKSDAGREELAIEKAEDFAAEQHSLRGQGWRRGGTRTFRHNAAGEAVGNAMEVTYGVNDGAPVGRLGNR